MTYIRTHVRNYIQRNVQRVSQNYHTNILQIYETSQIVHTRLQGIVQKTARKKLWTHTQSNT